MNCMFKPAAKMCSKWDNFQDNSQNQGQEPYGSQFHSLWLAIPGDKRMPLFTFLIYNSQQLCGWIQTQVEGNYFKASLWVFMTYWEG